MPSGLSGMVRRLVPTGALEQARRVLEKLDPHVRLSYSQDGEDMLLRRIFEGRRTGFYVDVGAHHPYRFSNTFHFHRKGWRGVNIDADPQAIEYFRLVRPSDINLCTGIGEVGGMLQFHRFNEPALNTFDISLAADRAALPGYRVVECIDVEVKPLAQVLGETLPDGQKIDFLSVDVEGFDFQVLRSNDWMRFRPEVLLVEVRGATIHELEADESYAFARSTGYSAIAKTQNTVIFRDERAA